MLSTRQPFETPDLRSYPDIYPVHGMGTEMTKTISICQQLLRFYSYTKSTYCCLKSGTAFILRIMFPFSSCCVYQLQHDAVITGGMNRQCEIASAAEPIHRTRYPLPIIDSHAFQAKLDLVFPQETLGILTKHLSVPHS